jgi:hypothetical protein
MQLYRFFYFFSVKGHTGGLFSLDFQFLPEIQSGAQDQPLSVQEALQRDFEMLESILDGILVHNKRLSVAKTPTYCESSYSIQAGYEYEGTLKRRAFASRRSAITSLLPPFAKDTRIALRDVFVRLSCELLYAIEKSSTGQTHAKTGLKTTLGHQLNLTVLHKILDLPNLLITPEAEREITKLNRLLDLHKEDPARLLDFPRE